MKEKLLLILLIAVIISICGCNKTTIVLNNDQNKIENNVLSNDSLKAIEQNLNKFKELLDECTTIPKGYKLITMNQMHHYWKNYSDIPSPNYFESDLNGDKKVDFAFIMRDSNTQNSFICSFISFDTSYNFYIIDSAVTFEKKNQIIIYPNNEMFIRTPFETFNLKNTSINSILIWDALEYTYYWNKNRFDIIMYD